MGPDSEVSRLITSRDRHGRKQCHRRVCCTSCILVWVASFFVVILAIVIWAGSRVDYLPDDPQARAEALLIMYPVIDGHNDLAMQLRSRFDNQLRRVDLTKNGSEEYGSFWQTDIPRLRAGKVGGQFWSSFVSCDSQFKDAARTFIDQIDIIKLFVRKYPDTFMFATSVADIESADNSGRIASLVGVEGGHAIDSSLATLRQLYDLGARYLTLTHTCNTLWAHSSVDVNTTKGLNDFGKAVVHEMNRLGMLVDISHVNNYTMMDVLATSEAPVMFSHSSARALCDNPRNVPDNVLAKLEENQGIVMVNFYSRFINCTNPESAALEQVADHIDHIREVAGIDHIGIGSDFDGIDMTPSGLEDVSTFPALFAELIRRGYSDDDISKISRKNLIRVFTAVEKLRDDLVGRFPDNRLLEPQPKESCRPNF